MKVGVVRHGTETRADGQLSIEHLPDLDHMISRREMDACKARLEDVFYGYPDPDGT